MAINLEKGASLNLSKQSSSLAKVQVGLGWNGADLDLSAYLLKADGKVPSDGYFVFFNQLSSADGSVIHSGDDREGGDDDGDNEVIEVDLTKVAPQVEKVVFLANIYDQGVSFGDVTGAYIRIVDAATNTELVRYDLGEDFSSEVSVLFAELYRDGSEWQFRALGQGSQDDLATTCRKFGVNV